MERYELLRNIYVGLHDVFEASVKKMGHAIRKFDITPAQLGVLINVPQGGATMSEIVRRLGCAPSNMTAMVRRLERDGIVYTARNPEDQRENLVYLTEKGQGLRERAKPVYADFLENAYGHLTTAEQMMLCELLEKLRTKGD